MRRAPLLLPLLVPALLLTACGDDAAPGDTTTTAATARPTASPRTAQPSAAPSGAASPSASVSSSPSAPASPAPAAPMAVPAAQGDVDGDGEPDEIGYEGAEAVVVLSGSGRTVRASTEAAIDGDEPVTSGVEDLDRDGRAEVFVQVGQGASTGFLLVLRYDGRVLAPLTVGGAPRLLAFGGSATHGDGFSCTDAGTLVVRTATSDDGEAYALETVTYRVRGDALVETGRVSGTAQRADAPEVGAAYVVDCRSVGEGS